MELAKQSKTLEDVTTVMSRSPERIRKVAMRLGVSFKSESNKEK
jgi:hypothetical protein